MEKKRAPLPEAIPRYPHRTSGKLFGSARLGASLTSSPKKLKATAKPA
jgi:hypothetical protein